MTMLRRGIGTMLAAALLAGSALAGPQRVEDLKRHVAYLASDELEGRLTGSKGEQMAAEYLVKELKAIGAQPLPGYESFLFPFEFTAGVEDTKSSMSFTDTKTGKTEEFATGTDFRALSFCDSGEATGPLVFAGYGLTTPDASTVGYDSYHGLDVKDKIVLVLRYHPEDADDEMRSALARYSGLRYKALRAREMGAKGVLIVTGPRSPNAGELVPMSLDVTPGGSGIIGGSITPKLAQRLFDHGTGKNLEAVQKELDSGNPHVAGFDVPGVTVTIRTQVDKVQHTGNSVVAWLPPQPVPAGDTVAEYVVFGAHYDHLGRGQDGNSLARKNEQGQIHHGADDNASGTAAILEVAREFARPGAVRQRGMIFGFWSGEEFGLLGSMEFLKTVPELRSQMVAYLNCDMVGRPKDGKLIVQGTGSSPDWAPAIEKVNVKLGLDLSVQADPWQPTDSTAFYEQKIPALQFFSGNHPDYHRPTDTAEKLNYEGLDEVVDFVVALGGAVAAMPKKLEYAEAERSVTKQGGGRDTLRAYTGVIPDYAGGEKGLLLNGVQSGGPAAKAGLLGGDLIVEFAGKEITNIYDYTYVLDTVKIGKPVKVVYLRNGKRFETELVPASR